LGAAFFIFQSQGDITMAEDKDDLTAAITALLGKHNNDASAAINQLLSENFKLREDKRELKKHLDEAGKTKPAEGSVVLSKAEAEKWKLYQEFGKPEEIKAAIGERDTLKTEVATANREQSLRDVAEVEGWNFGVIKRLAGDLAFEIIEGKDDKGNAKKYANVILKNGDRTETKPAVEYAEKEWKEFLPSLKVNDDAAGKPNNGTQYVKQPGAKSQPMTRDDAIQETRKKLAASGAYTI
jgi:hypothetical protein